MKKNQGFSLIELVVSIAILAIVGVVLVGFMSVASKTFRSVNSEVNLQYESQLTVNQLKDLIVDSNRGIAYGLQTTDGSFTPIDFDVIDSETQLLMWLEGNPANVGRIKRCLMIYNEIYDSPLDSYSVTKIVWDPDTKQLSYAQKIFENITDLEADQYLTTLTSSDYYLMSEYVEDFSVLMLNTQDKSVSITLVFENSGKTYKTTPSIALRNKVIVSSDIRTIYADTGVVRPSLINSVDIKKGTVIITSDSAKVGDTVNYTASVNVQFGANDANDAVQWILEDNSTYGAGVATELSQDGTLNISQYELSTQIKVIAMSVIDNSKKATVLITVQDGLGEFGYVNSLTLGNLITGDIAASTAPGGPYAYYGVEFQETDAYISYVNGDKLLSSEKGVTWTVTSNGAPAGSYSWGLRPLGSSSYYGLNENCPVYVKANYGSMGYEITVTATSNGKNYSGNNIVTQQKFSVTGLQMPIVEIDPTISLDVTGTNLSRNGKLVLTKNIQNVENLNYTLSILSTGTTGFNDNVATKNISNVYIDQTSDANKYNLLAKTQLDWNTDFTFTVRLHVTGETNTGNPVDKTIDKVITVPKVEVAITPSLYAIKNNTYSIPVSINYTNLIVGSSGEVDKVYYPQVTISNIYVYYYWWGNNLNLNSMVYNNSTNNIQINNLFRNEVFYYYNKWNYGTNYDYLTLTFKIYDGVNSSNTIYKQATGFTMSYY